MGDDIEERIRPIVDRVAGELATEIVAIAREVVRSRMLAVIDGETPSPPKPARTSKLKLAAPRGVVGRASLIAKAADAPRGGCGKCGKPGHNARSCGRAPKGRPRAKADDDEDEHALPARDSVEHHHAGINGANPPPSATRPHEPALSIPDDPMPASLAVVTAIAEATMLDPLDRREVCPLHGWLGRAAFQRGCHASCEEPVEIYVAPPVIEDERRVSNGVLVRTGPSRRIRADDAPRAKTTATRRISRLALAEGAEESGADDPEMLELLAESPRSRADCVDGPRPCPWVRCRHHLFLDVNPETGSIKLNFPDRELWDLQHTCALDIAERGGVTLEEIGEALNITRERGRQIETNALLMLKGRMPDQDRGVSAAPSSAHVLRDRSEDDRGRSVRQRRADLAARGLCTNGAKHGSATHGRLCEACRNRERDRKPKEQDEAA